MNQEEFITLDINDKADHVWKKGIFLESFAGTENAYALYSLYNFYIEITIERKHYKIIDISPLADIDYQLEKYIDRIDLHTLSDPHK